MGVIVAATFNLGKFPGFRGESYRAEFSDAGGLRHGNIVQIGGIRVGRVNDVALAGDHVVVTFDVDSGVDIGTESSAAVGVLNLLGEKYLDLVPAGPGDLDEDQAIPLDRTTSSYDVVGVFSQLTTTTEAIDTDQLDAGAERGLDHGGRLGARDRGQLPGPVAAVARRSPRATPRSSSCSSSSRRSAQVLADRSEDLVSLMQNSSLVFDELQSRSEAIHQLLVNARELAKHLKGVATDNQAEIGPALQEVRTLTTLLNDKDQQLKDTLHAFGPYTAILGNIIGTGPWFDAYVSNLARIFSGEFVPGPRGQEPMTPSAHRAPRTGSSSSSSAGRCSSGRFFAVRQSDGGQDGDGALPARGQRVRRDRGAGARRQRRPGHLGVARTATRCGSRSSTTAT